MYVLNSMVHIFIYSSHNNIAKMAIVFTQDISSDKLLMAYNNNVVKFKSDSTLIPATCQISGLGIDALLYPHPDGSFYFNFKDYITAEINTTNFADNLEYQLTSDVDTYTYNVSNGCYLEGTVTFIINFTDTTFETITRVIHFVAGVEQLETYKRNEILFSPNRVIVLSPVANRTNNTTYLKYWEGYPFEFSIFNKDFPLAPFKLKNRSNGLEFVFNQKGKVTSLFLSDGRTDVTIEDFLPLVNGHNNIQIFNNEINQNLDLVIDKIDSQCGIYIKFLNKYGRYNYWLLSAKHFRGRSSKYLSEIQNDFENLEDTKSPTITFGKSGDETMRCAADMLDENEKIIFEGIIDSPKIYMFTGERFARASTSDWMEVRLKTSSFQIRSSGKRRYNYFVEFDLPSRNTQTL